MCLNAAPIWWHLQHWFIIVGNIFDKREGVRYHLYSNLNRLSLILTFNEEFWLNRLIFCHWWGGVKKSFKFVSHLDFTATFVLSVSKSWTVVVSGNTFDLCHKKCTCPTLARPQIADQKPKHILYFCTSFLCVTIRDLNGEWDTFPLFSSMYAEPRMTCFQANRKNYLYYCPYSLCYQGSWELALGLGQGAGSALLPYIFLQTKCHYFL